jgi:gamma-glutamyl-gamma-aminobutyraldehyde dehydrogenase
MSSLLTREEYTAIAHSLQLPSGMFLEGKLRSAITGGTFPTYNPATGLLLNNIALCRDEDVALAVDRARTAFREGSWSKANPAERKAVLIRLCKLMRRHQRELAVLESLESGKPVREIETVDIPEALHCLSWHAELSDKLYGDVAPTDDNALALIRREPIGVVACVLPWNFPILMLAWKLGPALATGNSVIVKPAEETSMTALRIAELAHEAGVPRGVLAVVTGPGEVTGKALGLHPDIDMVSMTGSTATGRLFLKYAADSNLKRIVLECGGKNPCVVLSDADNLDVVAEHAVQGLLWNMGENCSANSRLIIDATVKDALLERVLGKLREWRMGDPLDPVNRLGAIVSKSHFERVLAYIEKGKKEGARLITGGSAVKTDAGFYIEPTVFDDVRPDMTMAREEIFGPVLAVLTVNSFEEAIAVANDTNYGLTASVFSADVRRAHRAADAIRAGTVTINCFGEGDVTTPFGGYRQSGFGGRDKSKYAHEQYTELKTIWLDLSDASIERSID